MPVRLIPNQLVKLFEVENFNQKNKRVTQDYREYCQVVRDEQTTMFQVQLLPDQDSIIVNGFFENDISGWQNVLGTWQWASGRLQGQKTGSPDAFIYQQISTTIGRVYKLTVTIQFVNISSVLTVTANQGTVPTWIFYATDYGLDPFTVDVYWTSDLATANITFLLGGASRDLVYIDDVYVQRLSLSTATLEDCNGNLIETIPAYAQANDFITYKVDWFGKAEQCYRICLTGTEDTENNYLDFALALGQENGGALELEQGGYIKWYG